MQVLLKTDVEKLGRLGDVVDVANGYARNYLLPKGIAVPATAENLRTIEKAARDRRARAEEELVRLTREAEMLDGYLCFITARATEQGHLFGSVGTQQVADHLVANGFASVRAQAVRLDAPIEEVGDYETEVVLDPLARATITVRVSREEDAIEQRSEDDD